MIYALYPQARVSMHVLWGLKQQNTVFAVGKSILDRTSPVAVGPLMLEYGGGGEVLIEVLNDGIRKGVRLTFSDKGPGIADVNLALKDGYTTGGGLGLGLSGARRLSNEFSIDSKPGEGTRVAITRWR